MLISLLYYKQLFTSIKNILNFEFQKVYIYSIKTNTQIHIFVYIIFL